MGIFSTSADDTTKEQRNFVRRDSKERQKLADQAGAGGNRDKLRASTTRTKTKFKQVGGRSATKGRDAVKGTRTAFTESKFDSISFNQAIEDFEARGGADAEVQAQTKAGGGGSGAAVTSFQPGVITAPGIEAQEFDENSITAVNSKQRGR